MATASSNATTRRPLSLGRKIAYGIAAVVALLLLWLVINFGDIRAQARLGASYGAHVACSCRYVQGRDLQSCKTDFEPGMEMVSLADDPANKRVTASVPLLAKAVAERRSEFGCVQLNALEVDRI